MKFEEALPYLRDGKIIRVSNSFYNDECCYSRTSNNGETYFLQNRDALFKRDRFEMDFMDVMSDNWEVWDCNVELLPVVITIKNSAFEFFLSSNTPETWDEFDKKLEVGLSQYITLGTLKSFEIFSDKDAYWEDGHLHNSRLNSPESIDKSEYNFVVKVEDEESKELYFVGSFGTGPALNIVLQGTRPEAIQDI